jgi:arylsulfatase A-like enzyme
MKKMKIKLIFLSICFASLFPMGSAHAMSSAKKLEQPNILFILIDDMGWRDLGCYGHEIHETPNIDRLAAHGMRFTDGYAASPVCSPTRASIMTGKYPSRTGISNWIAGDFYVNTPLRCEETSPFMKLEELTLAEALKAGGYQTGFVGKWHLGGKSYFPQHQGFDVNVAGNHKGNPGKGCFSPHGLENLTDGPEGEYLTDRLTTEAVRLMDGFSKKEKPWLLYMSYYTVHCPFIAKPEKIEKYTAKARAAGEENFNATYAAMVESLDENVGRLLDWLDEKGLRENTLIVFTSDNGGFHEATHQRPLRGYKGELYEGGIRVPLMVDWPGVTKPGSVCDKPVVSTDFYPTLLEAAGLPPRPEQHIDGVSVVPLLKGDTAFDRGATIFHYPHYLPRHSAIPGSVIRDGDWKLIYFYEGERTELYNLREDIGESENLADRLPEKTAKMKAQLDDALKEHGAKIPVPDSDYDGGRIRSEPPRRR